MMLFNRFALAVPTDSPWFFVACGALIAVLVAFIVYCLLRRPKFGNDVAATPNDLVGKTGIVTEEVDADAGTGLVTIDGEKHRILDPTEAGWTHCHTTVLFNKQETAKHRIEITMAPGDEGKTFTILGFGVVR